VCVCSQRMTADCADNYISQQINDHFRMLILTIYTTPTVPSGWQQQY
jgi:hypothetical protein